MSTQALQTTSATVGQVSSLLTQYKDQIAVALPKHMTPERMIRIALTAISGNKALLECQPLSLCAAVVQASILGLEINTPLGEGYLIPFKNNKIKGPDGKWGVKQAQFVPGYRGLLKLVRNSNWLSMVDAQPVHEGDGFDYAKGLSPYLLHKRAKGERGPVIGFWAGYILKDGAKNFEFMTVEEIEAHRDRYSPGAYDRDGKLTGAWADDYDAVHNGKAGGMWMYKKTVLKQLMKLMPMSIEAQAAVGLDDHAEAGLPQRFTVDVPLELQTPTEDPDYQESSAPEIAPPQRKSQAASPTSELEAAAEEFVLSEADKKAAEAADAKRSRK
jgi:recombination protein RecT